MAPTGDNHSTTPHPPLPAGGAFSFTHTTVVCYPQTGPQAQDRALMPHTPSQRARMHTAYLSAALTAHFLPMPIITQGSHSTTLPWVTMLPPSPIGDREAATLERSHYCARQRSHHIFDLRVSHRIP